MTKELINFRGAEIPLHEAEVLQEIELFAGKTFSLGKYSDEYETIEYETMQFNIKDNRVNGLALSESGLITITQSIEKLKLLK